MKVELEYHGLDDLLNEEGLDMNEFIEQYGDEGSIPGICTRCGDVSHVEPDCSNGVCETCKTETIKSGFVLMGVI